MVADRTISKDHKVQFVDEAANTTTIDLVTAVADKVIFVLGGELTFGAGSEHQLLSAATAISGKKTFPGAGVWNLESEPEYRTVAGEALRITRGTSTLVQGEIWYKLIDA